MHSNAFDPTFDELPTALPIFPLTGVLLLPRAKLPLNVFEPRYLNMTFDALANGRMIGIIQPRDGAEGMDPAIYETGCAGRIVSFAETDDGRLLITLRGVARFTAAAELPKQRGYRRVRPDFTPFAADVTPPEGPPMVDREALARVLRDYFALNGMQADWSVIAETPDEALISTLAMICPFAPREKQALLECRCCSERAQTMIALMEMRVRARDGSDHDARAH